MAALGLVALSGRVALSWSRTAATCSSARSAPHRKARSQENPLYPRRLAVPDNRVNWTESWFDYQPTDFTAPTIIKASYADPEEVPERELLQRKSYVGKINLEAGLPLNPHGRTGLRGRGSLGKWGPNHAADPIVTRRHPETGQLQVVAIQRADTGAWALPGGFVEVGEQLSETLRREFMEEACGDSCKQLLAHLFSSGKVVYQGYVDDPRNTDNAWIETVAVHFDCSAEIAALLPLEAGDDAVSVTWLDVDVDNPAYRDLYANHRDWVDKVAEELRS